MDLNDTTLTGTERNGIFARIGQAFAAWRTANQRRRAIVELSYLDARLLRDMGLEPLDLTDALNRRAGRSVLFNPIRRPDHE